MRWIEVFYPIQPECLPVNGSDEKRKRGVFLFLVSNFVSSQVYGSCHAMIRVITIEEVNKFAELGRKFYESTGQPGKFNTEVFCSNWQKLIANEMGFILGRFVNEEPKEAIGTVLWPDVHTGAPTACSTFWFYTQDPNGLEGGMLDEAWECYCKARDAKELVRCIACDKRVSKVGGFLLKNGYHLDGMQYRKTLCQ